MSKITILPSTIGDYYADIAKRFGSPLLILDCEQARQQYRMLKEALPGVDLYYAMKAQSHPAFLEALIDEGAGIDVATNGEVEVMKGLSKRPHNIIHTHPFKKDRDIRTALEFGCRMFVVDSKEEMVKFVPYASEVELLLRVCCKNEVATIDLSKKFGCPEELISEHLQCAQMLGLRIKGLSFHVGSQCPTAEMHAKAIRMCLPFYTSNSCEGSGLEWLDIGGGFPAPYNGEPQDISAFCAPIREALAELPESVAVVAEPGRFLAAPSFYSISTVMGATKSSTANWYFLDDGVYGLFSGAFYSGNQYPLQVFSDSAERFNAVLAGPTCDSVDVIYEDVPLPPMKEGELVVGPCMGAYTLVTATEFNSIPKTKVVVLNGFVKELDSLL